MRPRHWKGIAAAVLMLAAGSAFAGTETRVGTSGFSELRLPVGARGVALGGALAGNVTGAEALFNNPAGLAGGDIHTELLFSYAKWLGETDLNYFAVAQNMGGAGWIGFSAKVLSIGEIPLTSESAPDGTGELFTPTYSALGVTYAKALTDRVNFGGTATYIAERIMNETGSGLSFDFGFQYDTGVRGIRFGLAMKHYGPAQSFTGADFERNILLQEQDPTSGTRTVSVTNAEFELPSLFAAGVSYPIVQGANSFTLHGLYQSNSFDADEARVGAELGLRRDLALRVGYKLSGNDNDLFSLSYGAGLRLPLGTGSAWVDYAGQQVSDFFEDVHHISLRLTF